MSRINEKLGLKPAGKRAMMNLPENRAKAAVITSAQCPACEARGQTRASQLSPGYLWCPICNHHWKPKEL